MEATARQNAAAWPAVLTGDVPSGQRFLRTVLTGPLTFTPDGRTYRFEGEFWEKSQM